MATRPQMKTCAVCHVEQTASSMAVDLEDIGAACIACAMAHDTPGKFEGNGDLEGIATALVLYAAAGESGEDDFMSSDGWGYCGQFGQYLLFEDTQGFVTYADYGTVERAQMRFSDFYDDGWGASEDDAWISEDRGRFYVTFDGKELDLWPNNHGEISERRAVARVRLESMRTGYWPNLWIAGERGDVIRRDY